MQLVHSGDSGDVLLSLPCVIDMLDQYNKKHFLTKTGMTESVHLILKPHEGNYYFGGERFSHEACEFLRPLLKYQEYFTSVEVMEDIDVNNFLDLSLFRKMPVNFQKGNLARIYSWTFQCAYDNAVPYLSVEPIESEYIIVNRTKRNRNSGISYSFMRKYRHIGFVGLKDEFEEFVKEVPAATHIEVPDAYQLAAVIGGSRFFVGNASLCWNIAEGLKSRRLLEVSPTAPNVCPSGPGGYDAINQLGFQYQFERMYYDI